MHMTVRLSEPYWRQAGVRQVELELGPAATVHDMLAALRERYPGMLEAEVPPTVFLDDRVVEESQPLHDGAAATIAWALSGG